MSLKFILYKIYLSPQRLKRLFFRYWNRLIFTLAGISYGRNMEVYNRIYLRVSRSSEVSIGDSFTYTSGDFINPICCNLRGGIFCRPNAFIHVGDNVGISSACLWADKGIKIGNNVNIGGDCLIMDTDAHSLDYSIRRTLQDSQHAANAPIIIEDDVLIGARSVILKGVTIGARSVIGAGSIVTKSIPPDSIAAGNPCKVIRTIIL